MGYFTETVGVPYFIGLLVIMGESVGAVLLAIGVASRFIAASLLIIMIGAASMHWQNGFFMNFLGNQQGEGLEYFILASAMALFIVVKGGGALSLDLRLIRKYQLDKIATL